MEGEFGFFYLLMIVIDLIVVE